MFEPLTRDPTFHLTGPKSLLYSISYTVVSKNLLALQNNEMAIENTAEVPALR